MIAKHRVAFVVLAVSVCIASLGLSQTITTNLIKAAPNFREVDGSLYNVEKSTKWTSFAVKGIEPSKEGMRLMRVKAILDEPRPKTLTQNERVGAYSGPSFGPTRSVVGWENLQEISVRNCPPIARDQLTNIYALRIGIGTNNLELWEYGTPHFVVVVTTNKVAK